MKVSAYEHLLAVCLCLSREDSKGHDEKFGFQVDDQLQQSELWLKTYVRFRAASVSLLNTAAKIFTITFVFCSFCTPNQFNSWPKGK